MSSLSFISLILLLTADTYFAGSFTATPTSRTAQEGTNVSLTCNYSEPASITWQKDGAAVSSSFQVSQLSPSSSQLVILSVQHSTHAGEYHCVANTTSAGQVDTSTPFTITVQYLSGNPSITIAGMTYTEPYGAEVGSMVTLQCNPPEGLPEPTISWTYESNFDSPVDLPATNLPNVQLQNNDTQLVITSVQTSDGGIYRCITTNVIDSRTAMLVMTVADHQATVAPLPPTPNADIPYDTICGRLGSSVTIACTVVSGSVSSWLRGSATLTNTSRISLLPSGSLVMTDIQPSDAGQYKCRSTVDGISNTDAVTLIVNCVEDVMVITSDGVYKAANRNFLLGCDVHVDSEAPTVHYDIIWRHNGTVLSASGVSLAVNQAQVEDSGTYSCTVDGSAVTPVTGYLDITVESDPEIKVTTVPVKAKINHQIVFTCTTTSTHSPKFKWYNGSTLLSNNDDDLIITNREHSSILTMRHYVSTTTQVVCLFNDTLKRTTNVSVTVVQSTELYATHQIEEKREEERNDGQLPPIQCPIAGGIGQVTVKWYFGSKQLVNSRLYRIEDRTLTILSLNRTMDGVYRCVGEDTASQNITVSFSLFVIVPGYFITYPGNGNYPEGSEVVLECLPAGKPLLVVRWLRELSMLHNDTCCYRVYSNGTLVIKNMTRELTGAYKCYMQQERSGGIVSEDFSIGVLTPSNVPTGTTDNQILGFHITEFIGIVLGCVGALFLILTILLVLGVACYCCCCRRRNGVRKQNGVSKTALETTSFDRRASFRSSLRKDNSGILAPSTSNMSNLFLHATDQPPSGVAQYHPAASLVSGSIAVSPGPPVPSPVPPPTSSLITDEEDGYNMNSLPLSLPNYPRHNLKLGEVMGEGEFGPVLRGVARQLVRGEEHTEVAVKVLMRREGEELQTRSILTDFVSQMNLSSPNICTILGLCSDMEPYYIIYQYLDKGDLKQFLLESRPSPMSPPVLTHHQLKRIVQQVAHGMNYLYTQQIIHGDLATRNCLISSSLNVKIADLGIGHDLYGEDYYDNGSQLLPIRWMAPELLVDFSDGPAFSLASDIWSYGVLCWEVFSYATQPYSELTDEQVLRIVPRGHCLNRPEDGCPSLLYSLMQDCWSPDPYQRPLFNQISSALLSIEVD